MATFEETLDKAIEVAVKRAILKAHPVGSLYLSLTDENPSAALGGGTWVKVGSGMCLWGADSSHGAGTTISAGLPNITGEIDLYWHGASATWKVANNAFSYKTGTASQTHTPSDHTHTADVVTFDASRSSSLYGASTTVQPPALAVNIWKRTE